MNFIEGNSGILRPYVEPPPEPAKEIPEDVKPLVDAVRKVLMWQLHFKTDMMNPAANERLAELGKAYTEYTGSGYECYT